MAKLSTIELGDSPKTLKDLCFSDDGKIFKVIASSSRSFKVGSIVQVLNFNGAALLNNFTTGAIYYLRAIEITDISFLELPDGTQLQYSRG